MTAINLDTQTMANKKDNQPHLHEKSRPSAVHQTVIHDGIKPTEEQAEMKHMLFSKPSTEDT
jgi:hypothetical protein